MNAESLLPIAASRKLKKIDPPALISSQPSAIGYQLSAQNSDPRANQEEFD